MFDLKRKQRRLGSTAQKMKFSIKDFFRKCDQICKKLRIWSHLLNKFLMENFIFCAVKRTNSAEFEKGSLKTSENLSDSHISEAATV